MNWGLSYVHASKRKCALNVLCLVAIPALYILFLSKQHISHGFQLPKAGWSKFKPNRNSTAHLNNMTLCDPSPEKRISDEQFIADQMSNRKASLNKNMSRCLVFTKPHKSGSQSFETWLHSVASSLHMKLGRFNLQKSDGDYFRSESYSGHSKVEKANYFAGHVVADAALKEFVSKYCHGRMVRLITIRDPTLMYISRVVWFLEIPALVSAHYENDFRSLSPKRLSLIVNLIDPIEILNYLDGGTSTERSTDRVEKIAAGIDWFFDTEDILPDLACACSLLGMTKCPCPRVVNVRSSTENDKLKEMFHHALRQNSGMSLVHELYGKLKSRRLRFQCGLW